MILVMHIGADFYSRCAKTYQTLMVPALFCKDISPRLNKTHMGDYWPHTLPRASQLQVAGCCPTEVDAIPLVVNLKSLSIEVICIKAC